MDFGIGYFPTDDAVSPGAVARLVQEHGQDSLFFAEHTHIPASRESPYPGGGELPRKYSHTYDLFVALTAAAVATSTLRIGSGICLVVERDPITTAKEVASLDHMSGGRFESESAPAGIARRWPNHGTDPRTRMRLLQERVEAMKAIWTQNEASYEGEFLASSGSGLGPNRSQRPHPPVLVGGNGPTVLDRVLAFGDAWFPNYGRAAAARVRGGAAFEGAAADRLHGDGRAGRIRALDELRDAGASRVVHWIPSGGLSVVEEGLERWEAAIARAPPARPSRA